MKTFTVKIWAYEHFAKFKVLSEDNDNGGALYYLGLMYANLDRPDLAFEIWRKLLKKGPDNAPWVPLIREQIMEVAWRAGKNRYALPAERKIPSNGPTQADIEASNEMTADERKEMIEATMKDIECKYYLFGIPDINNYDLYVSHLEKFVPKFDCVYSGNPLVQRVFKNAGYQVNKLDLINREVWEGSAIRQEMKEGGDWELAVCIDPRSCFI